MPQSSPFLTKKGLISLIWGHGIQLQARSWGFPEGVRIFFRTEDVFLEKRILRTFFRKGNFFPNWGRFFLFGVASKGGSLFSYLRRRGGGRGFVHYYRISKGVRPNPQNPPSYAPELWHFFLERRTLKATKITTALVKSNSSPGQGRAVHVR